jgi:hypothetical protein
MGIRTVDYAAGGVYVVPTNGKEPYCSKLASVIRKIIVVAIGKENHTSPGFDSRTILYFLT